MGEQPVGSLIVTGAVVGPPLCVELVTGAADVVVGDPVDGAGNGKQVNKKKNDASLRLPIGFEWVSRTTCNGIGIIHVAQPCR